MLHFGGEREEFKPLPISPVYSTARLLPPYYGVFEAEMIYG